MAQSFQTTVALPLASLVAAAAVSCGPRTDMDPTTARARFSSKSQSLAGASKPVVAVQPVAPAPAPQLAATPAPAPAPSPAPTPAPAVAAASTPTAPVAVAAVRKAESKPETKAETKAETRPTTKTESPSRTTVAAPAPVLHEPPEVQLATEARRILTLAATSKWPALRAHALEAAIKRPQLLEQFAPAALADDNRGVRFVACMSIAESRDTRFTDRITPLLADPSPSVQAAAMLALSRAGASVNFSPLASMVYDNDPEIRANAYLVLGELGNPSAIPLIRDSLGKGMKLVNPLRVSLVNLAAAEALVKLGDQNEVEPIRAALFAPPEQGELTIVACDSVRRLKDEVARAMLERIVSAGGSAQRSPEIRLAAVRALAALGATKGPAQVAIEYIKHPDARIRSQAAVLLGEIGTSEARAALGQLLADQDPTVQIAAAGGLDSVDTPASALRQAQAD